MRDNEIVTSVSFHASKWTTILMYREVYGCVIRRDTSRIKSLGVMYECIFPPKERSPYRDYVPDGYIP